MLTISKSVFECTAIHSVNGQTDKQTMVHTLSKDRPFNYKHVETLLGQSEIYLNKYCP